MDRFKDKESNDSEWKKTTTIISACIPPSKLIKDIPLNSINQYSNLDKKHEECRAYHARLDLMETIIHPDQSDYDWQVETITDWTQKHVKGWIKYS